jgi:bifunctional UDP-N-acetylglucosamine pyrophosphorylase / glucosamine-1-phosphate N-acetyltransferase
MQPLHIIILAAGKGVRMNSSLPKVLQPLGGKPLLAHVVETAKSLQPKKIHIVYGAGGDQVKKAFPGDKLNWVQQKKQLGTAHAVSQVLPFLPNNARVLILYGDVPLIKSNTLQKLVAKTAPENLGLLVAKLDNPRGFGRILRDKLGNVISIIEEKDASLSQKEIKEINTGIMFVKANLLKRSLPRIKPNNAQKEYYLTDLISLATTFDLKITAAFVENSAEIIGVNDKVQLAQLERIYQMHKAHELLQQGVTIIDPMRFDLRGNLHVAKDVTIDINSVFEGEVFIGANSYIGANCFLRNVKIGENVSIKSNCVIEDSIIEDHCLIGPFARIRPESHIKRKAHVGNFVEVKKTTLGEASKANHLTYLGDAEIGKDVNIGAGTITCNYDGVNKYQTIIEDGAFIGSDTQFIAPVRVGKNATIGAGSTIATDAPRNKLTLSRARQVTVPNWRRPTKAKLAKKSKK